MVSKIITAFTLLMTATSMTADDFVFIANYDEAKIPPYQLPDVLEGVKTPVDWTKKRAEWHALLATEMFGKAPTASQNAVISSTLSDKEILGGKATLKQIIVTLAGEEVHLALFLPATAKEKPAPVFLGYNFNGNHTVFNDPDILLPKSWVGNTKDHKASEADRGTSASRWAIERITDAGFGLVTLYYGDIDPDKDDGFKNGVHKVLGVPAADGGASIATWSWALSRVLDLLETVPDVDAKKVAIFGHSRLGKTSLWAGATDERFAMVISNDSGCGGAALSRRQIGETVWRINNSFPHWFCCNFKKYSNKENDMPFDSHVLLALCAPRPLYVASAEDDQWADPKGEFLSCVLADPVYKLLGTDGIPVKEMPEVNSPVHGQIGYHIRTGKHDVKDYDWEQYVTFAKKHLLK
jgi:hypothetical protein